MTGVQEIAHERYEQIFIHGYTIEYAIENPQFYDSGQLIKAAEFCLDPVNRFWPENWNGEWVDKIILKTHSQRLIIAAALLAAEYDRLKYISEHKIVDDIEIAKDFKDLDLAAEFPVSTIKSLPFVETIEQPLSLEYKDGEVRPETDESLCCFNPEVWVDMLRGFQVMYAVYSHGSANIGTLASKVTPLKMRYDDGERTAALYNDFNFLEEELLEEPTYKDSHYYKEYRYDKS